MTIKKRYNNGQFGLLILIMVFLYLLFNKVNGQDTSFVTFESIGYTYEAHSDASYKLVNLKSDTILVDNVRRINPIKEVPAVDLNGRTMFVYDDYGTLSLDEDIYFDGFDSHIEIAQDVYLKGYTGEITIVAIINPHKLHYDYLPIFTNKSGIIGYGLRFVDGNYLEFGIGDGTEFMQDIRSNQHLVMNQENYVAITFNGSEFRYYFDGELDNVIPYTMDNMYVENNADPFYVGSYGRETTTDWFEGTLRLEVFKKALTAEEVSSYPTFVSYYVGIGPSIFGQYPIYYQVMGDSVQYLEGASLIHYRTIDQLIQIPRWIRINHEQ